MSDLADVALGERLRDFRRAAGVSQETLAEQLGITSQQVQRYERGVNRIPASLLARTGRILSRSVAELMGEVSPGDLSPAALEMARMFESLPSDRERDAVVDLAKSMAPSNDHPMRRAERPKSPPR